MAILFPGHATLTVTTSSNDGAHSWRNSIDIVFSEGAGAPLPGEDVITQYINWLRGMQRNDCTITEARLRNWSRGDVPLVDQPAIWVESLTIACNNIGAGNVFTGSTDPGSPTVGEVCILMAKTPFGRAYRRGHTFIRNCIPQESIHSSAGGPPLLNTGVAAGVIAAINTYTSANLADFLTDADLPRYCIVHLSKAPAAEPFDTPIATVLFERLTMHDIAARQRT